MVNQTGSTAMQRGYALHGEATRPSRAVVTRVRDEDLVESIARGNRDAMRMLYARHSLRVYRFILRLTADASLSEDVLSDVFLIVWRQADAFEAKSKVSTWLLGIARFKAMSALRRRADEQLDDAKAA